MVVRHEFVDDVSKMPFTEEHEVVEAFVFDRLHGLRFGLLAGSVIGSTPLERSKSANAAVKIGSRS